MKRIVSSVILGAVLCLGAAAFVPPVFGCGNAQPGSCKSATPGAERPEPPGIPERIAAWLRSFFS